MANDFYTPSNVPTTGSSLSSSTLRAEFQAVASGLDKLPTLVGNAAKVVRVNSGGTALEAVTTLPVANGGTGSGTGPAALVALGERTSATGSAVMPAGTPEQRDASPLIGYTRFNTMLQQLETYTAAGWQPTGGGATGGDANAFVFENVTTVTADYTVTTGKNAMTAGPITLDTGVVVTVPTGSTWSIV